MLNIETGKKNTILRAISEKILLKDISKYSKLAKEMFKYIKNSENGGVGLAAPQVGYNIRLIIVSLLKDRDDENFSTIIMFNPEIIEHDNNLDLDMEGCLSVPGEKGKVKRFHEIKLNYIDIKGKQKILFLEGLSARIVQHEIDHLDGILFTDKIEVIKK